MKLHLWCEMQQNYWVVWITALTKNAFSIAELSKKCCYFTCKELLTLGFMNPTETFSLPAKHLFVLVIWIANLLWSIFSLFFIRENLDHLTRFFSVQPTLIINTHSHVFHLIQFEMTQTDSLVSASTIFKESLYIVLHFKTLFIDFSWVKVRI